MPAFLADNDNDNEAGKDFRLGFLFELKPSGKPDMPSVHYTNLLFMYVVLMHLVVPLVK